MPGLPGDTVLFVYNNNNNTHEREVWVHDIQSIVSSFFFFFFLLLFGGNRKAGRIEAAKGPESGDHREGQEAAEGQEMEEEADPHPRAELSEGAAHFTPCDLSVTSVTQVDYLRHRCPWCHHQVCDNLPASTRQRGERNEKDDGNGWWIDSDLKLTRAFLLICRPKRYLIGEEENPCSNGEKGEPWRCSGSESVGRTYCTYRRHVPAKWKSSV